MTLEPVRRIRVESRLGWSPSAGEAYALRVAAFILVGLVLYGLGIAWLDG